MLSSRRGRERKKGKKKKKSKKKRELRVLKLLSCGECDVPVDRLNNICDQRENSPGAVDCK